LTLPVWMLESLLHWLDALQAEEMQAAALAGSLPWLQPHERRRITRAWQKAIQRAQRDNAKIEPIENPDPQRAREWFARLGARIEGEKVA